MRMAALVLISLLLQGLAGSCTAMLHLEAVRPDPAIALVALCAMRLDWIAGAVVASAIGFGTDLMASSPPGLHMLAYTLVFVGARFLAQTLGLHRGAAMILLALAASAASRLVLSLLLALFAEGDGRVGVWNAQLMAVAVDGLLAYPIGLALEPLLRRAAVEAEGSGRWP
ncbi:MAG: hypothetical protein JXR83_16365 [Deltaproteobacteria bacterium]|nr:hypothetical protein [Deltaproteobacteria bacterium]